MRPLSENKYAMLCSHWRDICVVIITTLMLIMSSGIGGEAFAHPEDDFCDPAMEVSQELCWKLSELNSSDGKLTGPLLDEAGNQLSPLSAALYFGKIGVQHILPGGLDHILFVLALFLIAKTMRSLILQISVFTVAHTVTLGMTAAGVIEPPGSIVEPLIALSIAIVAIEALFKVDWPRWRLLVIFGFGLFHGMGFAGFIREIGLPTEQFWPSLIGFNIGVEIGQISVVLLAALLCWPLQKKLAGRGEAYQSFIVKPAALIIAAIGLWWFLQRSLGL